MKCNATITEIGYLSGVTSNVQTQLNSKLQESDTITDWGLTEASEGGSGSAWTWDLDNGHLCEITLTADATITISSTAGHTNTEAKLILNTAGYTPTFVWSGMTLYYPDGGHDWTTNGTYVVNISKVGSKVFVVEQLMATG